MKELRAKFPFYISFSCKLWNVRTSRRQLYLSGSRRRRGDTTWRWRHDKGRRRRGLGWAAERGTKVVRSTCDRADWGRWCDIRRTPSRAHSGRLASDRTRRYEQRSLHRSTDTTCWTSPSDSTRPTDDAAEDAWIQRLNTDKISSDVRLFIYLFIYLFICSKNNQSEDSCITKTILPAGQQDSVKKH